MERQQLTSSSIRSVGYDQDSKVLEVEFTNTTIYQYSGVPKDTYEGLISAASAGSYFDTFVKKIGYTFVRIS